MALAPDLLFNLKWYLDHNPDVAEALANGDITAPYQHFLDYGKAEGRSSSPLFNVEQYLIDNPDVGEAVENGLITAYDHFIQYGASEGRTPSHLFDAAFYLSQNPDVAAAVEENAMTAIEHFLMYGQSEPRPFSPSIDLGAYLDANPDIEAAVAAGQMSALEHLMLYGASEGRDLGNGVDMSIFADDESFADALAAGDVQGALDRVAEVAPFLPTFVPPENWEAPADTPIPVDFVPPEGTKLVIPPTVVVPPDMELPDTFEPVKPVDPVEPVEPVEPPTTEFTKGVDKLKGTDGKDQAFLAAGEDGATIQSEDSLDGGTGDNKLFIKSGAILKDAAPELANIQKIVNSDINPSAKYLDLSNTEGLQVLETDYSEFTGSGYAFYRGATAETVFSISNVSALPGVAGIHVALRDESNTTVKIALDGNAVGSYIRINATDKVVTAYEIETMDGNDGQVLLAASTQSVTVTGAGNFDLASRGDFGKLVSFDASAVTGNVTIGGKNLGGAGNLYLGENFVVKTGSGVDMIDLSINMASGSVDAGAGDDTIIVSFNTAGLGANWMLTGGEGSDTFIINGYAYRESLITIEDFDVTEEDTLTLDISGPTNFATQTNVDELIEDITDLDDIVNAVWLGFVNSDESDFNAVQFEHSGNTYVVYGEKTTTIKLTGVDLGLSNTNVIGSELVSM